MTKDLTSIQNELMDMKRKNVDLQQRLDIFHYKMGEEGEMISSTHSNSSTGTRSIHEPVFPADRATPERKFLVEIFKKFFAKFYFKKSFHEIFDLNFFPYLTVFFFTKNNSFRTPLEQRNDHVNANDLVLCDASHKTQNLTRRDLRRPRENRLQREPGFNGEEHRRSTSLCVFGVVQGKQRNQ
jgi:hypothetical protein